MIFSYISLSLTSGNEQNKKHSVQQHDYQQRECFQQISPLYVSINNFSVHWPILPGIYILESKPLLALFRSKKFLDFDAVALSFYLTNIVQS